MTSIPDPLQFLPRTALTSPALPTSMAGASAQPNPGINFIKTFLMAVIYAFVAKGFEF